MKPVRVMTGQAVEVVPWPVRLLQRLEEHHLCAWSGIPDRRRKFGVDLAWHLAGLNDTQVCVLEGSKVTDLASYCTMLERSLGLGRIERVIDPPLGVVGALRRRLCEKGTEPIKRRYYIWLDADVLLRRDAALFGRLADAMLGVAAEAEYVSEDLLLLQRTIFVGGPALDVYAEDRNGQFQRWWSDGTEPALWNVVTGVAAPRVVRHQIGAEVGV